MLHKYKNNIFFFLLEQKETKIQEKTIATAQATRHRVFSFLTLGFITVFFNTTV